MRHLSVWVVELFKLVGRRRLHPLRTPCPICGDKWFASTSTKPDADTCSRTARALYEGSLRYGVHYASEIRCVGSGNLAQFDPRPNEHQRFKLPSALLEE